MSDAPWLWFELQLTPPSCLHHPGQSSLLCIKHQEGSECAGRQEGPSSPNVHPCWSRSRIRASWLGCTGDIQVADFARLASHSCYKQLSDCSVFQHRLKSWELNCCDSPLIYIKKKSNLFFHKSIS